MFRFSFSYAEIERELGENRQVTRGDFLLHVNESGSFYTIDCLNSDNETQEGRGVGPHKVLGWKIHIGIDDSIPGNMAKAWNSIKHVILAKEIASCKIVSTFCRAVSKLSELCCW